MESLDEYHIHEQEWDSLDQIDEYIEWIVPDELNTAYYISEQWANDKDRVALFYENENMDRKEPLTFSQLENETNKLANYLYDLGLEKGDRVAVNSSQKPEKLISYIAIWKLGAVPVPLSRLFGPDAIEYRLNDSNACCCIVDKSNLETYNKAHSSCEAIEQTLVIDNAGSTANELNFWDATEGRSQKFEITRKHQMMICY